VQAIPPAAKAAGILAQKLMKLTDTEARLLQFLKSRPVTLLPQLSSDLGLSRNHTQNISRALERRGYVTIAPKKWRTDPLHISLAKATLASAIRPNFDKLMISTVWV